MSKTIVEGLSDVSETLLLPLYWRAAETRRPNALVRDPQAVELVERLDYDFSKFQKMPNEQVTALVRVRVIDRCASEFMFWHPGAVIVHIGCGLDTRFNRIDNGTVEWFDLDLPEVIALRRQFLPEHARIHLIAASVFDFEWMDVVAAQGYRAYLFLAEGVLPYFEQGQIKQLVLELKKRFPGSELVFDAISPSMVWMHNLELAALRVPARLHWGVKNGAALEAWDGDIRLLDAWYYFDQPEARLRGMGWLRHVPGLNKSAAILHYQLGQYSETVKRKNGRQSI